MANSQFDTTTGFRVHVIDVGQGDSILLEAPNGDTMLIDSGPEYYNGENVLNYLKEHDIDRLDHLVATHYDADHIGGHAAIIREFGSDNIGTIHGPRMDEIPPSDSDIMHEFEDTLEEHEIAGNELQEGSELHLGGVDIDVLNPSPNNTRKDRNENSVVMHCTYGEQSVLLAGDIEHGSEARLVEEYPDKLGQTDVTKISHHGSQYSTSEEFLAACETETAIFSHSEKGDDHPHKETLYRTADGTDTAVSTALHGSTVLDFDGEDTITIQNATSTANFAVMTRYCREHDEAFDTALVEDDALAYEDLPRDIPLGVLNDTSNVKLPKEVQQLRDDKKELQSEKDNIRDRYGNLQDRYEDHQDKYGDLLDKYEGVLDENEDLREQVDALQTTLDDFIETKPSGAEPTDPVDNEPSTAAEMATLTTAEQVNTAITKSETVEEVRQTLDDSPDATDHLREVVQTDRDDHVPTVPSHEEMQRNRRTYRAAKQAQNADPTRWERFRAKIPTHLGGTDGVKPDAPDPDDIEGPRSPSDIEIPEAAKGKTAAETRLLGLYAPSRDLVKAEQAANTSVETAENAGELCWGLRNTPGAHKDFLHASQTPNAHKAAEQAAEERAREKQQRRSKRRGFTDRDRDKDEGRS